jgi:hypothetical protein
MRFRLSVTVSRIRFDSDSSSTARENESAHHSRKELNRDIAAVRRSRGHQGRKNLKALFEPLREDLTNPLRLPREVRPERSDRTTRSERIPVTRRQVTVNDPRSRSAESPRLRHGGP